MNAPAKSGHEGVQRRTSTGLYRARVRIGRKRYEVGQFATAEEAAKARVEYLARVGKLRGTVA